MKARMGKREPSEGENCVVKVVHTRGGIRCERATLLTGEGAQGVAECPPPGKTGKWIPTRRGG